LQQQCCGKSWLCFEQDPSPKASTALILIMEADHILDMRRSTITATDGMAAIGAKIGQIPARKDQDTLVGPQCTLHREIAAAI
jgi:hypothetical protein